MLSCGAARFACSLPGGCCATPCRLATPRGAPAKPERKGKDLSSALRAGEEAHTRNGGGFNACRALDGGGAQASGHASRRDLRLILSRFAPSGNARLGPSGFPSVMPTCTAPKPRRRPFGGAPVPHFRESPRRPGGCGWKAKPEQRRGRREGGSCAGRPGTEGEFFGGCDDDTGRCNQRAPEPHQGGG